jgi:hypothetical protein
MQTPVLPTLAALLSAEDERLEYEIRLAAVRAQAAVVRAVIDDVESLTLARQSAPLHELVEEIARLTRTVLACCAQDSRGQQRHHGAYP